MKKQLFVAATVACAALTPAFSSAQVLLNDTFDTYFDQAAFVAAWPAVGATPSGALQGTNYVSPARGVYYDTTAQRNERSFAESGVATPTSSITFSFNFYEYNPAAAPYRQYANLQDGTGPTSTGQLVSMGLNNNLTSAAEGGNFFMARILGFNSSAYFKLNDNPALVRTVGWHSLAVTISDVDFKFYVDGFLAETVPQTGLTLRSYDLVRLGSGVSSTNPGFFDNVRVEINQVPEPGVLSLAAIGVAALFARRRVRK